MTPPNAESTDEPITEPVTRDAVISDEPETLIGVSFDDSFRASEFLTAVTRLHSRQELHLKDAVVVTKNANGDTNVKETVDPGPGSSALSGAVWAGLFGLLLGGPVGWIVGGAVGAGVGAATAKIVDIGIPDEWVKWFREAVRPGTTTIVVLVTKLQPGPLVTEAERFAGAQLVYANLDPGRIERIKDALRDPN